MFQKITGDCLPPDFDNLPLTRLTSETFHFRLKLKYTARILRRLFIENKEGNQKVFYLPHLFSDNHRKLTRANIFVSISKRFTYSNLIADNYLKGHCFNCISASIIYQFAVKIQLRKDIIPRHTGN